MIVSFVFAGVLIVSVRWRNTTFSGSLIDMGQHEWAPPRWATQILSRNESDWSIAVYILACLPPQVDIHTLENLIKA